MSLPVIVFKILKNQHCNSNGTVTQHHTVKVMIQGEGPYMISHMYVHQIQFQSVIVMLINA